MFMNMDNFSVSRERYFVEDLQVSKAGWKGQLMYRLNKYVVVTVS